MAAATRQEIPVNPDILIWARTRAGFEVDEVASKIKVKPQRIKDWESGKAKPTPRQGRMLAKTYERPFLEFFARSIPEVPSVELVPDFRMYTKGPSKSEIRALKAVQEWAEEQRVNALSLIEDLGDKPPVLSSNLKFSLTDNPETASGIAREAMGFPINEQLSIPKSKKSQLPNILRDKIEQMGVLVLKQNGLTKLRARGICLYAEPLPIIVFGGEAPSAQAFTLAHEFGHVLTGTSAISGGPAAKNGGEDGGKAVEDWCNSFAASLLIPAEILKAKSARPAQPANEFDLTTLADLASMFGVSRHAMLIRLVGLDYVVPDFYWKKMRPIFLAEEAKHVSYARPAYWGKRYVNSRGLFYTGLVLEAWGAGLISSHNAAEYMGISNLQHLLDIKKDFGV